MQHWHGRITKYIKKTPVRIARIQTELLTPNLHNTNQGCQIHDHDNQSKDWTEQKEEI